MSDDTITNNAVIMAAIINNSMLSPRFLVNLNPIEKPQAYLPMAAVWLLLTNCTPATTATANTTNNVIIIFVSFF